MDSGLGGRLETRGLPFGGSGKEPILEVLRRPVPGVISPDGCEVGEFEFAAA